MGRGILWYEISGVEVHAKNAMARQCRGFGRLDREVWDDDAMMKFVLKGQIPSGKNAMQVTRTGRHYPLARFVRWRSDATRQLREQGILNIRNVGILSGSGRKKITVRYFSGDVRRRDVPGMMDAICHLLEWSDVVVDDALLKDWDWKTMEIDRDNPRCEICMEAT